MRIVIAVWAIQVIASLCCVCDSYNAAGMCPLPLFAGCWQNVHVEASATFEPGEYSSPAGILKGGAQIQEVGIVWHRRLSTTHVSGAQYGVVQVFLLCTAATLTCCAGS